VNYSNRTAPAATASPRGMELDMENLSISSPVERAEVTRSKIPSGLAGCPTPATESEITPARSGVRLSEDERTKLARIRRNRREGWMPTFEEFYFLLEIVETMSR
jgi:hypothetical protein